MMREPKNSDKEFNRPRRLVFAILIPVLLVAVIFSGSFAVTRAAESHLRPSLPVPTLGGTQFWRDVFLQDGWRIQRHVYTGHHRLLDPRDVRHAWGSLDEMESRFEAVKSELAIPARNHHLVVLVHGIAPSPTVFSRMKDRLKAEGFDVIAPRYPSTRNTIQSHASGLSRVLEQLDGTRSVSFVTHSMGGLVVRQLLASDAEWRQRLAIDNVIMIAPPNQGSAFANALRDFGLYQIAFGAAGQQLVPDQALSIPALDQPFAIIAGGRGDGNGFNPFLNGDDDGTVKVSETTLPGAYAHDLVDAMHSSITGHEETIRITLGYLQRHKTSQIPETQN